jgi:hypothetical protein
MTILYSEIDKEPLGSSTVLIEVAEQGPPGPVAQSGQSYAIITAFTGNAIPAATGFTNCTVSPDFYLPAGGSGIYSAEGVEGTLRRVGTQYSFSRTTAGTAVTITPNTSVFIPGRAKGLPTTIGTVDEMVSIALLPPDGSIMQPLGREAVGDSNPPPYRWNSASVNNTPLAIRPTLVATISPGRFEAKPTLGYDYFGIVADIATTNTAAITRNTQRFQAAVEYCMATPALLQLPPGIIRINDSIKFNQQSGGSKFRGVSMRGTIIEQRTDNKPCFDITANLFNAAEISNLQFQWANNQPATNKDAIAIRFSGQDSCFECLFTKLFFNNGFRGIESGSVSPSALGGGSLWGNEYSHIWSAGLSGATIYLGSQVGSPQNDIRNVYILGGSATERFIYINAGLETTISTVELNINPSSQTFIECVGGTYAEIRGVRTETNTSPNLVTTNPVFLLSNSHVVMTQVELTQTIAVGANNVYNIFRSGGNARLILGQLLHGFTVNSGKICLFSNGLVVHATDIVDVAYDSHGGNKILHPQMTLFDNLLAGTANDAFIHQQNRKRTTDVGDGDITLDEWSAYDHYRFTTALTATRTVTFPSAFSENCQVGRRFKISKLLNTAQAPTAIGDLRCIGVDGSAFVIPAAARGWVEFEYYRLGWSIVGSGTFL